MLYGFYYTEISKGYYEIEAFDLEEAEEKLYEEKEAGNLPMPGYDFQINDIKYVTKEV